MKLRGLYTFLAILVVGSLLLLASRYHEEEKSSPLSDADKPAQIENILQKAPKKLQEVIAQNIEKKNEMVERVDFNQTAISQERLYTEAEINEMSEEDFGQLLKEVTTKLPVTSDIKKIPAEALHRTPELVIQAGRDLGLIKEVLSAHPSFERAALKFYEECAKNKERPNTVRALCLTNIVEIKKNNDQKVNLKDYPSELVNLVRMVTDF